MRGMSGSALAWVLLSHHCHGGGGDDTGSADDGMVAVTAADPEGWTNSRAEDGDGGPCEGMPHAGTGSLCLSIDAPGDDGVSPAYAWEIDQDFGPISSFEGASFDFYRLSSSTSYGHFAPAVWLEVEDPADGSTTWLVWEAAYNGYAPYTDSVPVDAWTSDDLSTDNWWQWRDGADMLIYDRGVLDWPYSDAAEVEAIGLQLGSGWNGSWAGYADLLSLTMDGEKTTWNFE